MSKQLAQVLGGRKGLLWLVPILAAFAVFAGVGLTSQSAKADVTGTDFCLDENNPVGDTTVECSDDTPVTSPVQVGDAIQYKVSIGPLTQPVLGNLVITATLDDQIISVVTPNLGPATPTCVIDPETSPGGESTVTCTYYGPIPAGTQGTLLINTVVTGDASGIQAGLQSITAKDTGSAQAAQNGQNLTDDIPVDNSALTITKSHSPASPTAGQNVTWTIVVDNLASNGADVAATNVVVTDTISSTQFASVQSISTTQGSCSGVGTLPDTTPPWNIQCNLGTLAVDASATITIVATLKSPLATPPGAPIATNQACVGADNFQLNPDLSQYEICDSDSIAAPTILLDDGLYNVDANGNLEVVSGHAVRDDDNNLIGGNHIVCLVTQTGFTISDIAEGDVGVQPPNTTGWRWRIDTISGTSNVQGQVAFSGFDPTNSYLFSNPGINDLDCVTWNSTAPGEQNITIVDPNGAVIADWADGVGDRDWLDGDPLFSGFTPLVKEWNTLTSTTITATPNGATNLDGLVVGRGVVLNPSTGVLTGGPFVYYENVFGSHQSIGGTVGPILVDGALSTFTNTGTCGAIIIDLGTVAFLNPTDNPLVIEGYPGGTYEIGPGQSATFITSGMPIKFWFDPTGGGDSIACTTVGNDMKVSIVTTYQQPIGSVPPAPITETLVIRLVAPQPSKQVLLAWAGQRIILEHDYRIPPGDYAFPPYPNGDTNVGFCPFEIGDAFQWIKGSGPGNFVNGLGVLINGSDQAVFFLMENNAGQTDEAPEFPQSSCIARVLYESEDPGEVDVELFAATGPAESGPIASDFTKVAFVIYYMKFEVVNLGLVTNAGALLTKPSHNGSVPAGTGASVSDYSPGNPWDASKDITAGTQNVSTDVLVRGRVKGWFLNANPSGRPADTSNPYNILPANRWVMPDDWAMLAGGPADPADGSDAIGTAESFRPYYDIMIAPNNKGGLALADPTGMSSTIVAYVTTATGLTNSATTFAVTSISNLPVGSTIAIPSSSCAISVFGVCVTFVSANGAVVSGSSVTGVFITIPAGVLMAAPAAGTPILLFSGVPFEGPMSLIDIPGLASTFGGVAGAAMSNFPGTANSFTRDIILKDGDVDMWDAPMPPALISIADRGAGFIKQVLKEDVYYNGTANSGAQNFPNPFYFSNIPDSPWIPAFVAGSRYIWDSWGGDGPAAQNCLGSSTYFGGPCPASGSLGQGPYHFWQPARVGANSAGIGDPLLSSSTTKLPELNAIRAAYGDPTIARDLVVYSDNHGEFMVTANGDFNTDLSACATNVLAGGKHCKPGDKVGTSTLTATADYPDFQGKHFPVASNTATIDWTWGGYKDVTIEKDPNTPQYLYVVFHAVDRDGVCNPALIPGMVSLHPVLSGAANDTFNGNPAESVDFLIDSGAGIIFSTSGGGTLNTGGNRQFATGVTTFSTATNTTILEFPNSPLAASATADECQAWIKVSNSLLGIANVLVIAHDDEGDIGFDKILDFQTTASFTLSFRWTLITWTGADNIPVTDALHGTGANDAGNDIFDEVTAVYGWDAAAQDWLGFFPSGVSVPGANDLTALHTGQAYWIAIAGPGPVTWTIATNVGP